MPTREEILRSLLEERTVELSAHATPVSDTRERREILSTPSTAFYREARTFELALRYSPIVSVIFTDNAT